MLFAALLLASLLIFSYLIGIIFFGNGSYSDKIMDPASFEFSPVVVGEYFVDMIVYWIPGFLVITTIAFMLSTLFKKPSTCSRYIHFHPICLFDIKYGHSIIHRKIRVVKIRHFPHLDLRGYISGTIEMFDGATLGFSMGVLGIYYLIFLALTFFFFQKKISLINRAKKPKSVADFGFSYAKGMLLLRIWHKVKPLSKIIRIR
ncbi:hypothetical protein RCO48_20425 [Peribacillus frigoritolerans]|nr:hypothetical protein [Peribacillus frigoritolerans]